MSVDDKVKDYSVTEQEFLKTLDSTLRTYRGQYNQYVTKTSNYKHLLEDFLTLKKNYKFDKQTHDIKCFYDEDKGDLYYILGDRKVVGFNYKGRKI